MVEDKLDITDEEMSSGNSGADDRVVAQIAAHYEAIIRLIGEDVTREGLLKTPLRAAKALMFATGGYRKNVSDIVNGAVFSHEGSRMIIVRDIEFYSFCEHHILPFFGKYQSGIFLTARLSALAKWLV